MCFVDLCVLPVGIPCQFHYKKNLRGININATVWGRESMKRVFKDSILVIACCSTDHIMRALFCC